MDGRSEVALRYELLLLRLHEIASRCGLDSEEADLVREEMDGLWEKLGPEEQEDLAGLSERLNVEPEW